MKKPLPYSWGAVFYVCLFPFLKQLEFVCINRCNLFFFNGYRL